MIKIGVVGCCGKMGKRIIALAVQDAQLETFIGFERKDCSEINSMLEGVIVSDDLDKIKQVDVVIDFTPMTDKTDLLNFVIKHKKTIVIGTTGLSVDQVEIIKQAAKDIAIVYSPNMSVGVNVMFDLVKQAAAQLKEYKVRIIEAHHIHKKDAPSGTAKQFAAIIESQTNQHVEDIEAIREGEIVGDHEIIFESDVDIISLSHKAKTRDIFAKGALDAAKWVANKPAGLYNMHNVLEKMKGLIGNEYSGC
ncbi:MAG: 4-hydroxy-tetrahydrodipicolinate reductase [Candidatus Omnitrophica bacterium]|nr:4-hydroxy-tetrahydrodipicolinate reductase [Candidatus Omnitrophota bacterium]